MDWDVCTGCPKISSGWQKAKGKFLPGRENALCRHQSVASERGQFLCCVGRDGYSFRSSKGPQKAWHVLNLAGAAWGCGIYPLPTLYTDMTPPCLQFQTDHLGWSLSGHWDRSRLQGFCVLGGQDNSLELKHRGDQDRRLPLTEKFLISLSSGVPAPQG